MDKEKVGEKYVSKEETENVIRDSVNKAIKNILRIIEATYDYEKGSQDPKYVSIRKTVLDSLNTMVRDINSLIERQFSD